MSQLDRLLRGGALATVFQPVYEVGSREHGRAHLLECLTRGPAGTNLASPAVLFEYVRRKGREDAIDRLCVSTIFSAARALPGEPVLAVNVHAATFQRDPRFPRFLVDEANANRIAPSRLVLEIVEHAPSFGGPRFLHALRELREEGIRIALDDIGLGQSNYRMILDCDPEYLKIDAFLVRGCAEDPRRLGILDSLVHLARRLQAQLVAEGIETRADLEAVVALGIRLAQGFHLGKPRPANAFSTAATDPLHA